MKITMKRVVAIENLKKNMEQVTAEANNILATLRGQIQILENLDQEDVKIEDGKAETKSGTPE